ncbi:MAG: hypothetical protein V2I33_26350 [Kangiellaceae bacterium]|jgi:hypothetical protein|nr:hypothetical protein [Kangiellaceae bacterium]
MEMSETGEVDVTEDVEDHGRFLEPADKDFNIAEHRVKGIVFFPHFAALLRKRLIYSKRDYKGICCEIFLPIILVLLGLVLLTQVSVFTSMKKWKEELK